MPKSEFYFLGRFIVRTNKSYRNDFYFKLKSRYTMYGQKSHSAKMVYLTTSDVIEYLTDCLVWNKWTINKSPIISNETKLKSIFISVFVVSLDISKSAYCKSKNILSQKWPMMSGTYTRNIFINLLLEAALTVAFFMRPMTTIYS